jgi:cell division protein FtsI (penicillin-binding protein 3)
LDPRAEALATKRLRILARICLGWGVLAFLRLVDLQILQHGEYAHDATRQHVREVEIQAPRGSIYDRNGQPLAMSTPVESVCINPMRLADPVIAAELLSKLLDLDQGVLLTRIASAVDSRRGFMWVKRKITPQEAAKLRSIGVDWIEFRTESSRYYPKGPVLAHVLGSVDHDEKGNAGIELFLNKELEGKAGVMRTQADVHQNVFDQEMETEVEPGTNITLTIDERIQFMAERELAAAVKEHRARTGSLVAMDPRNGHILAMANYPSYDPNIAPKQGESLDKRRNLAVTAPFEPGSVFKVITVATALETTRITPGSMFHCGNGRMTLFRRVIRDAKPNGLLSVADIIAKSSNIGAIKVGLEVGSERLHDYIRRFGFGQKTGLPLPGESSGVLRPVRRWIPSSIGSVAMGHEISTTTLQLARACSVIANGGYLVKPVLVMRKERPGSAPEKYTEAQRVQVIRPETAIKMRLMMERTVVKGTGWRAKPSGYSAGGKTGSAQIYDYEAHAYTHRYNGSFMGFAPVNDPKIVVVITLNGTQTGDRGFGGVVAAPVFRTVAGAALRFLEVPRDPAEEAPPDEKDMPVPDLAVAGVGQPPEPEEVEYRPAIFLGPKPPAHLAYDGPKVPDFHGKSKRAVLEESFALGVRVEVAGVGIARSQDPPAGVALRRGERVRVQFAP